MAEERDGKIKNYKLLAFIKVRLDGILESGKTNSANFTNTIPLDSEGNRILEDDKDTYDEIMNMRNYLERSPLVPEETYVIPGFTLYDENGRKTLATIYVPKSEAKRMAQNLVGKEQFYHDKLGIDFPAQVYQLQSKYDDSKIPGTDISVPEPRLMSESPEEYEERLERIYHSAGIDKELIPDTNIREPYPHEKVDYSQSDEVSNGFQSRYYSAYRRREAKKAINNGGPQGSQDDEDNTLNNGGDKGPFVVRESEDYDRTPLGQKIGSFLNITDSSIKSKSNHQKLKTLAAIAGVGAGGIVILTTPALQPLAIAAIGIGAIFAGAKAALKFTKNKITPKVRDFLFGRSHKKKKGEPEPIQPTPNGGQGGSNGGNPTPPPAPTPTPSPAPQPAPGEITFNLADIEGFLQATSVELDLYDELSNELAAVNYEIETLNATDPQSPELIILRDRALELNSQLKEQLSIISTYAKDFAMGMTQEQRESEEHTHGRY